MSKEVVPDSILPGRPGSWFPAARRVVVVLVALAAIIGGVALFQSRLAQATGSGRPQIGKRAPDFTVKTVDGQTTHLSALRGQTVILNFWATWCPPCRAEMPAINQVAEAYRGQHVVVVAVDELESPLLVQKYVQDMELSFVPVLDSSGEVAKTYDVTALPTTFFIGPDGSVSNINVGPLSHTSLVADVKQAMTAR